LDIRLDLWVKLVGDLGPDSYRVAGFKNLAVFVNIAKLLV